MVNSGATHFSAPMVLFRHPPTPLLLHVPAGEDWSKKRQKRAALQRLLASIYRKCSWSFPLGYIVAQAFSKKPRCPGVEDLVHNSVGPFKPSRRGCVVWVHTIRPVQLLHSPCPAHPNMLRCLSVDDAIQSGSAYPLLDLAEDVTSSRQRRPFRPQNPMEVPV